MAEFPAMPLWTDAYLGDTTHLTTIEHGAFLLLLITMWRSKGYRLPDDDRLLARYTHLTPAQWQRIKPVIVPFFRIENDVWFNDRLSDEVDAVRRQRVQRSNAGLASALKRKHRQATAVATAGQRQGNTHTQTHIEDDDDAPARAREGISDDIPFDHLDQDQVLLDQIAQATGVKVEAEANPLDTIRRWQKLELSDEEIFEVIRTVRSKKKGDTPERLAYFTKAMQDRARSKKQPNLKTVDGGKTDDNRTGRQSARQRTVAEQLAGDLEFAADLDREREGSD